MAQVEGFPKSHDISKAMDKAAGAEREVVGVNSNGSGPSNIKLNNHGKGDTGIGYMDGSGKVFNMTAPATDAAKKWDGWGTALKPAHEPVVWARKPLEKGLTIAENVLKHGTGAINIDGCRIGTRTENESGWSKTGSKASENRSMSGANYDRKAKDEAGTGRWPANVILTHHPECKMVGMKKVKNRSGSRSGNEPSKPGLNCYGEYRTGTPCDKYGDENGLETVEDWECHEDCPVDMLNEQSGELKSGEKKGLQREDKSSRSCYGKYNKSDMNPSPANSGGAARFFHCANYSESEVEEWECHEDCPVRIMDEQSGELKSGTILPHHKSHESENRAMSGKNYERVPSFFEGSTGGASRFFYCAKASKAERDAGCERLEATERKTLQFPASEFMDHDGKLHKTSGADRYLPRHNHHPTVKPVALMQYLIRLVCPTHGIVLDPFCGSGSTLVAALRERMNIVGIEKESEYAEIARARAEAETKQLELF